MVRTLILAAALAILTGCASVQSRPPVTVERVLEMTRQGALPADIIAEMRDARTVYRLSASQLAKLREQGVDDEVLDYMQDTYLDEMERRGRISSYDPYWYGPYPGAWPYSSFAWGGYPYYWGPPYYYVPRHRHPRPGGSGGSGGGGSGSASPAPDRQPSFLRPGGVKRPAYKETR